MKKKIIKNIDFERLTPESILELVEKYKHESPPYTILLDQDEIYAINIADSYNTNTGMAYVHIIDINGKYIVINESFIILIKHNHSIENACDTFNKLIDEAEIFYNKQSNITKNDGVDRDVN